MSEHSKMSLYVGPEAYLFERDLTRFTPKAEEILSSVNESASRPEQVPNINKKERRILKHELFLESMWRPPPPRPYPLTQNQTTIPFHPLYSFHLSLLYLFNYIWFTHLTHASIHVRRPNPRLCLRSSSIITTLQKT